MKQIKVTAEPWYTEIKSLDAKIRVPESAMPKARGKTLRMSVLHEANIFYLILKRS
jgi:hypothetical protein